MKTKSLFALGSSTLFFCLYPPKGFETSVSEDKEKLDIVRVVWAVQSCHLSTQLSRSLAKDVHCELRRV